MTKGKAKENMEIFNGICHEGGGGGGGEVTLAIGVFFIFFSPGGTQNIPYLFKKFCKSRLSDPFCGLFW